MRDVKTRDLKIGDIVKERFDSLYRVTGLERIMKVNGRRCKYIPVKFVKSSDSEFMKLTGFVIREDGLDIMRCVMDENDLKLINLGQ